MHVWASMSQHYDKMCFWKHAGESEAVTESWFIFDQQFGDCGHVHSSTFSQNVAEKMRLPCGSSNQTHLISDETVKNRVAGKSVWAGGWPDVSARVNKRWACRFVWFPRLGHNSNFNLVQMKSAQLNWFPSCFTNKALQQTHGPDGSCDTFVSDLPCWLKVLSWMPPENGVGIIPAVSITLPDCLHSHALSILLPSAFLWL